MPFRVSRIPQADTAEWGMCNSSADKHQSARHYVSADNTAGYAGQQATQEGMLKKGIL